MELYGGNVSVYQLRLYFKLSTGFTQIAMRMVVIIITRKESWVNVPGASTASLWINLTFMWRYYSSIPKPINKHYRQVSCLSDTYSLVHTFASLVYLCFIHNQFNAWLIYQIPTHLMDSSTDNMNDIVRIGRKRKQENRVKRMSIPEMYRCLTHDDT